MDGEPRLIASPLLLKHNETIASWVQILYAKFQRAHVECFQIQHPFALQRYQDYKRRILTQHPELAACMFQSDQNTNKDTLLLSSNISNNISKIRSRIEIRNVFHGTSEHAVPGILRLGLNPLFADSGKNGSLYGTGVYVAKNMMYCMSERYSPIGSHGKRYIFIGDAFLGRYELGQRNQNRPTCAEFHSTVNNLEDPSIFQLWNAEQFLPTYLLVFAPY